MHRERPAARAAAVQPIVGGVLALAFWLAATVGRGFQFSYDSMSYAALALGFDTGHPFASSILWLNARPEALQAIWPPLYPALIALVHAAGPAVTWSEWMVVGAAYVASAVFAIVAVREVVGTCPWTGVILCAGWPAGLAVAGFGWSEPVLLALLGLHYWLAARTISGRGTSRTVFAQGFAAGVAFLARYAAAPFIATAALLGPLLESARPRGSGVSSGPRWIRWAAGAAGAALPVAPWAAAALVITGRVGPPYVAAGGGLGQASFAAIDTALNTLGSMAPASLVHGPHAAKYASILIAAATVTLTLAALRIPSRSSGTGHGHRATAILCGLCLVDAGAYTAFLVALRAKYFFDDIDLRLMIPAFYPLLLAMIAGGTVLPGRIAREAWVLPLCALSLWTGLRASVAAFGHPQLASSMHPKLCQGGPTGDCGLLSWVEKHGGPDTLIVTNVAYPLNFATQQSVEALTPYPDAPRTTASMVAGWARAWERAHPGGEVLLALDAAAGPVAAPAGAYGPYPAAAWAGAASDPAAGIRATPLVTQPGYRVFQLRVDAP